MTEGFYENWEPLPLPPQLTFSVTTENAADRRHHIYDSVGMSSRQPLSEIVRNDLPIKMAFCDSVYGFCDSFTFTKEDLFDAHFIKKSLVANVKTASSETNLKIPLYADFEFTLLHADSCEPIYVQARELVKMTAHVRPKLVIVTKGCKETKKCSEMKEGEVLILQNSPVGSGKSSTKGVIYCFSLLEKLKKKIHKSSMASFLANPTQLKLSFTVLKHFEFPLPKVLVHCSSLKSQLVCRHFSKPCRIEFLSQERSLVASFNNDPAKQGTQATAMGKNMLYEILLDVPIDFQLVTHYSEQDKELLYDKTSFAYKTFSPNNIQKVVFNFYATERHNQLQKSIYEIRAQDDWRSVVELVLPEVLLKNPQYCTVTPTIAYELWPCLSPRSTISRSDSTVSRPCIVPPLPPKLIPSTVPDVIATEQNVSYCTSPELINLGVNLSPENTPQNTSNNCECHSETQTCPTANKNCKLEDLSKEQVIELLEFLGLSQYKKKFAKEQICGGLLHELDDEVLHKELGINSKLHRLKLLRVIEGRETLDKFFEHAIKKTY